MVTVWTYQPEFVVAIGAGPEVVGTVKIHAVRVSRWLQEQREAAVDTPFDDTVIGLVREEDISLGVTGRSLGKRKDAGNLLKQSCGGSDAIDGDVKEQCGIGGNLRLR